MNSAVFKDALREIRTSFGRFMSIFLIVALGCGFFAGLKATMPDMVETADEYFKANRLMDLKLVSTIGVRSADVEAVKRAEHVKGAHAAYSKDIYYSYNNQNIVLKCLSFNAALEDSSPHKLNTLTVIEGRLPENEGECAIEAKMTAPDTFVIGNTLEFAEPDDSKSLSETLAHSSYKIVGIVTSPLYIGYERDATTVGNGTVVSNVFLKEEEFVCSYYTELYVDLDIDEGLDPFSQEYRDKADEYSRGAIAAFNESVGARFDELMANAQKKLDSASGTVQTVSEYLYMVPDELAAKREELISLRDKAQAEYDRYAEGGNGGMLQKSALLKAEKALAMLDELIADGGDTDGSAHQKYAAEVEAANADIKAAKEQLALQNDPVMLHYNRFEASNDYSSFEGDSKKLDAISSVFPVFFIMVAALVCLTTMSRMIEEQRSQIGIYKALGFSGGQAAAKYLIYSLTATAFGGVIGACAGLKLFPKIIYNSYKIMYNIPHLITPIRGGYVAGCTAVAAVCTVLTVIYTCFSELKARPSELMRPRPPKNGKRVWLESRQRVWGRLSFLSKVTVRNLFRYKKRFAVTVIGVAGCTALIITGFGLKHSIKSIIEKQFGEVFVYDALVVTNHSYSFDEIEELMYLTPEISSHMQCRLSDSTAISNDVRQNVSLVVPHDPENVSTLVNLYSTAGERLELDDSGVIITLKLAQLTGLKAGDSISLTDDEGGLHSFTISGVSVNYALHYVYMKPEVYRQGFGEEAGYNVAFLIMNEGADRGAFKESFTERREIYGLSYKNDLAEGFLNSVDSLDAVVVLLIICAGLLAAVVLYNLANINITERLREIATVKVLGFYDNETSAYILRENYVFGVVGIAIGLFAGRLLHYFVVTTAEVDTVMFNHALTPLAYLLGAVLTMVFIALINGLLHFKLRKVSMVESLKSVE